MRYSEPGHRAPIAIERPRGPVAELGSLAASTMTPVLNKQWHGVLALIWLLCGFAVFMFACGSSRAVYNFPAGLFLACILLGWFTPAVVLAISGVRGGNIASRVCGALVLIGFLALLSSPIWVSLILRNH